MKNLKSAESTEKSNLRFLRFFRVMVIFVLKIIHFRWIFMIIQKIKIRKLFFHPLKHIAHLSWNWDQNRGRVGGGGLRILSWDRAVSFWPLIHKYVNFYEKAIFMGELFVGRIFRRRIVRWMNCPWTNRPRANSPWANCLVTGSKILNI